MNQAFVMGYTGSFLNACTHDYVLGNGYRWYNPALMRFMSSDHWSPFGAGGVNPYAYCADDPINFSDPSGHAPWSWFGKMARRVRAAFPDGSIAANNSTVHVRTSGSTFARQLSRLSRRGRSARQDRAPLVASYRAEEDFAADEEQYRAANAEAEHAWANRLATVPLHAAIAAAAADLYEAVARKAMQDRLDFVSNGAQEKLADLESSRPRLRRSHSLYGRLSDTALDGRGAQSLWDDHLEFLIRKMHSGRPSSMSEEDWLAMPGRIRDDMADTLMQSMNEPLRPPRISVHIDLDHVLPY